MPRMAPAALAAALLALAASSFASAAPLHPPRASTEPISIVWPPEGMTLAAENEFIFGSVSDPKAHFEINGTTVAVHKDGGFIAWLPISPGTFTFRAELSLSSAAFAERHILVPLPPVPVAEGKLAIDGSSLMPNRDLELRAGDWWIARMKASRGKEARLRIGSGPWRAMHEINPRLGLYEAVFQVAPGEEFGPAPIEYEIGSGWSSVRAKGTARVAATTRPPSVATAKTNPAGFLNVKTSPEGGFLLFPAPGARMLVDGREGDSLRVRLSDGLSGWVDARDVVSSTSAVPPDAETGNIGVTETPAGATVRIGLSERVPFELVESDERDELTVRLFSATGHTNIVSTEGGDDFVEQVRWRQEATGVVVITVRLKPGRKLWGFNAHYDNGSSLRLDLRRPPRVDRKRPLAGLRVMLDPGHMPSAPGAIGPLGTKEMDANYAIAEAAAALLKRDGAIPLLTRGTTTDEVSLVDRPRQAVERGADVFVSVHNNALPDGSNPFAKPLGFSVYYYHPHSAALGRAVHDAYAKAAPLPDNGLLWDNLLVARLTAVPAILIENAYIILPEQEALLNEAAFREKLARAIEAGLKSFMLEAGDAARKP